MDEGGRLLSRRVALGIAMGAALGGAVLVGRSRQRGSELLQIRPPGRATYNPLVRVNLTSTVSDAQIAVDGPFQLQPAGTSRVIARRERLQTTTLRLGTGGFELGGDTYPVSHLEIVPKTSPAIWVDNHQYRGSLRLIRQSSSRFIAVNVLPLEEYVASVIDSEMPAKFPRPAREAQAIVSRTYALYHLAGDAPHPHFDVHASTQSQRYLGYVYRQGKRLLAGETEESCAVAAATAGAACTWRGRIFCTYFAAVCGGKTAPGRWYFSDAAPPLQSVNCTWCEAADLYRWTATIPKRDLARRLWPSQPPQTLTVRAAHAGDNAREPAYAFSDGRRQRELKGSELRALDSKLRSPHFELRDEGDSLEINGRGHGHGAGLCQWGARGLALDGRSALDIVRYYYPGASVVRLEPPRA